MQFVPVREGELISPTQKSVIQSALVLAGLSQSAWAKKEGIHISELSRMLTGKLVAREPYARKLNRLVRRMHPVRLAA